MIFKISFSDKRNGQVSESVGARYTVERYSTSPGQRKKVIFSDCNQK